MEVLLKLSNITREWS